jgi:PTH1 family peptidyl-tRNA hydrolase
MEPRRLLFIASIGNKAPYRQTRHSAGHLLLDAVAPLLPTTLPNTGAFHETWYSPTYMNVSGPKLVRQLEKWAVSQNEMLRGNGISPTSTSTTSANTSTFPTTLVILHDELESPLGKVRVKRGGPESSSLRGHRGLISICETLRGKGLYPTRRGAKLDLSILRIGVGIGRPDSRDKGAVSDYVLANVTPTELAAYHRAAEPVVKVLAEELYRVES